MTFSLLLSQSHFASPIYSFIHVGLLNVPQNCIIIIVPFIEHLEYTGSILMSSHLILTAEVQVRYQVFPLTNGESKAQESLSDLLKDVELEQDFKPCLKPGSFPHTTLLHVLYVLMQ